VTSTIRAASQGFQLVDRDLWLCLRFAMSNTETALNQAFLAG
jgi:hypothetical protein